MTAPDANARILVVDDDADLNGLLVDILQGAGYATIARRNVADAATVLEERPPPTLLVADYRLPDGFGTDLCRAARRIGVRTIVVSAHQSALEAAVEVEPDAWLAKPFEKEDLLDVVGRVLSSG